MEKKKILVVCQHYWPENFRINDICEGFIENNFEVEVLCGIPNYPKGFFYEGYSFFKKRKEEHNNVKINRVLEIPRKGNTNFRILLNYLSFPFFSLFYILKLMKKKYDYIFIYELSPVMMALPGIILGKLKKIPTTMYVLDLWPENLFSVLPIKSKLLRKIAFVISDWHYKSVDKLICMSNGVKERLEERILDSIGPIEVIPQFCEKLYEKKITDGSLAKRFKETFNIVYTGNISPAQSFETIIEAVELLKKEEEFFKIKFIIVGDGMSKEWVERQVDERGLSDFFCFEGAHPIEHMPSYLQLADCLIGCLSKHELLGLTIPAKVTSYIAAGKPLILSMDGEAQKLVNENAMGFACDSGDFKSLYKNIIKLIKMTEEERIDIGKNTFEFHIKYLEREENLKRMIAYAFN